MKFLIKKGHIFTTPIKYNGGFNTYSYSLAQLRWNNKRDTRTTL